MSDRSPLDRPIFVVCPPCSGEGMLAYTADIAIHDLGFAGGELWIVATMVRSTKPRARGRGARIK